MKDMRQGIQEINSIISNAEIKIALETFANDVVQPFSEIDEFPEELTTNKGTRQDIALSKLNENEDFNNFIDEAEENYVILITDSGGIHRFLRGTSIQVSGYLSFAQLQKICFPPCDFGRISIAIPRL